jgi:cytoskeletal protein CcmA (bactofilin family)
MAERTLIGSGTFVRGLVRGDGDLEIAGRVEGEIEVTGEITIQPGALIRANVRGSRVVVRGAVAGDISAEQVVLLEDGARVVGQVFAPSVGVGDGAMVRGRVETSAERPARRAATPTPRAASVGTRARHGRQPQRGARPRAGTLGRAREGGAAGTACAASAPAAAQGGRARRGPQGVSSGKFHGLVG